MDDSTDVNDGHRTKRTLGSLESYATYGAAGLALLYSVGFVVVNSQLEQYEILQFQLVRSRYFAAALLFLGLTSVPFVFGFLLGLVCYYSIAMRRQLLKWQTAFEVAMMMVLVLVLYFVLIGTLIVPPGQDLTVDEIYSWRPTRFYTARTPWLYALTTSILAFAVGGIAAVRRKRMQREGRSFPSDPLDLFVCIALVGMSLFLAWGFGRTVFPRIRPAFGGGAAWLVVPVSGTDSISSQTRQFLDSPAVVFDRSDEAVHMLRCRTNPTAQRPFVAAEIPQQSLDGLFIERLVVISDYADECLQARHRRHSVER